MVRKVALLIGLCVILFSAAYAFDLEGVTTVDNHYNLYISTAYDSLGTFGFSSTDQSKTWDRPYDWETQEPPSGTFGLSLTSGVTNYVQVLGWDQGVIAGFLGSLTLNNSGFRFDNDLMALDTNAVLGWTAREYDNGSSAIGGSLGLISHGPNGTGIWADITGGPIPGINTAAEWIWTSKDGYGDVGSDGSPVYRLFTAAINPVAPPVPEPISSTLFLLGAGAFGLKKFRNRKKA